MQKPEFEIRMSNGGISMPCALCGAQMHIAIGPEIFLKGTLDVVCPCCVKEHCPKLVEEYRAKWNKYDKLKDIIGIDEAWNILKEDLNLN